MYDMIIIVKNISYLYLSLYTYIYINKYLCSKFLHIVLKQKIYFNELR